MEITVAIEILENPVTGETMHVVESNADRFVIEYALRPHGKIPLEHFHPNVEQAFAVFESVLKVKGFSSGTRATRRWLRSRPTNRQGAITRSSERSFDSPVTAIPMRMGCRNSCTASPCSTNTKTRSDQRPACHVG